jgi:hypothetical protein
MSIYISETSPHLAFTESEADSKSWFIFRDKYMELGYLTLSDAYEIIKNSDELETYFDLHLIYSWLFDRVNYDEFIKDFEYTPPKLLEQDLHKRYGLFHNIEDLVTYVYIELLQEKCDIVETAIDQKFYLSALALIIESYSLEPKLEETLRYILSKTISTGTLSQEVVLLSGIHSYGS